jgi:hypothetical protein
MDILTLTDTTTQLSQRMVRVTATQETDDSAIEIEAEDVFVGVSTPGAYATQAGAGYATNTAVDPGNANTPAVLQPPIALSGTPQVWVVASGGENWGGAELWASDDGASFGRVGIIVSPGRYGTLTANWPASADPDITGNLAVNLAVSGGALSSATQDQANGGDSLSWVGANGVGELLAFSNVTLTGAHNYTMSDYIRRGLYCSFTGAHLTGETFVRLDGAVAKVDIDESRVGRTIQYKLRSFNKVGGGLQSLASAPTYNYTVQPIGIQVTNGAVPSTIEAGQQLCVPENAQYSVQQRMTNYGRINLHGRLIAQ